MNFRKGRPREDLEINLIPFIDVLLVIVIFLMVTTTYSKFTALQLTLPTADAPKALEQPFELNIAVDANGRYALNNKRISARDAQGLSEEMQAVVRASASKLDPVIIINADALATHQTVVNVLEAARMAGYPKVTFAAQASSK
ncbi:MULTISPECIES: ExbD/TolR family protein [Herbaspirillum]|jgi:biopolymer transport protein ExbD|uniref:Biopolymer transport ExbD-related transmembrane protein n=1 Tax=Herbaspirillum seropedicae (strain SmR1) TaxID=757424 RepID=D8J1R4_HERSS|nr:MULTISPECIES: biopolymer transporter ExbD [Herbaspirillum]ADJ62685.1 biopolymer transport ExbD-related transmembrane protein [Herbaspirillum seropedicae SmR1]AKN64792.1 biopolymer transporter ExbD [Herbaspirillum seropedicae]AON53407.1 biopolymer transport ExbD-related transmembrane protein [Herbaspirillum seropedicae]MDR6396480.1 biopolymer transport protein ExbD [Herbaspirillum seropedicae]NQE31704.1 biopolymer transporter ExbD [Herbaspirillum seropedicae]